MWPYELEVAIVFFYLDWRWLRWKRRRRREEQRHLFFNQWLIPPAATTTHEQQLHLSLLLCTNNRRPLFRSGAMRDDGCSQAGAEIWFILLIRCNRWARLGMYINLWHPALKNGGGGGKVSSASPQEPPIFSRVSSPSGREKKTTTEMSLNWISVKQRRGVTFFFGCYMGKWKLLTLSKKFPSCHSRWHERKRREKGEQRPRFRARKV